MRLASLTLVTCLLLAGSGIAQQMAFASKPSGADMRMAYRWRDRDQRVQQLEFRLPLEDLQRGRTEFQPFDNAAMADATYAAVKAYASKASSPSLTLSVVRNRDGYEVKAEGLDRAEMDAHLQEMQRIRDDTVARYLQQTFYSKVDETHVMPDHPRIAARYAPALSPVQRALRQTLAGEDMRGTVDYLLSFLQTIPYNTLQSRYTTNGAGFNTPYALLVENRGDCDSKSVALAALLRGLFPTLPMTMVYVPNHAFVGLAVPRGPADYALQLGGRVFVLADPTGPRLMRLGEVEPRALRDLEAGRYSFQEIPF